MRQPVLAPSTAPHEQHLPHHKAQTKQRNQEMKYLPQWTRCVAMDGSGRDIVVTKTAATALWPSTEEFKS